MTRIISTAQWFKVTLPLAECGTKAAILRNDFETLYSINGKPLGAALFTTHDDENQFFYFSPEAVAIARGLIQYFSGESCAPPVSNGESPKLLVGHAAERDILLDSKKPSPTSGVRRKLDQILGRE